MNFAIRTRSRSKLLASDGKLAVFAVSDKDRRAARTDEYLAILEAINLDFLAMIEKHSCTSLQVVDIERVSVHDWSSST